MQSDDKKTPFAAAAELETRNFWRGVAAFVIILLGLGTAIAAYLALDDHLFALNPRFTLRNFEVEIAAGSPASRWLTPEGSAELADAMGLAVGESNLFTLDFNQLRSRAELFCPGIERIEVERVLPDTVRARVIERIPLAVIEPWMGDLAQELTPRVGVRGRDPAYRETVKALFAGDDGTVMSERDCGDARVELLPHVIVYSDTPKLALGERLPVLKWPLDLIGEVNRRPANLKLLRIDMRSPGSRFSGHRFYRVDFVYAGQFSGTAIMPPGNIPAALDLLEAMIRGDLEETGALSADYLYNVDKQIKQPKKDFELK